MLEQGAVPDIKLGAYEFMVEMEGTGLRPPAPSSVAPIGTPRRPTVEP
jgi:hypothetical protein